MARARAIDTRLEKLVPSMEEYFIAGIFNKDELHTVAKERTRHEYKLVAKPLLLLDVQQAIQYELDLERRIREYCAATSVNLKHRWVVQDRVIHLFKIGLAHLRNPKENEELRQQFVSTMRKFDRKSALSNHYATYVTKFPHRAELWCEAALWEVDVGNTDAARTIVQHALRNFSDKSVPLWVCSLSIEMRFLSSVMSAMLHDLAERQAKAAEGAPVRSVYEAAVEASGGGALVGIVFDEALAKLVVDGALDSPAFGTELFSALVAEAMRFNFSRNVVRHIVGSGVPKLIALRHGVVAPTGKVVHRSATTVGNDSTFADALAAAVVDLPSQIERLQTVREVLSQAPPQTTSHHKQAQERLHRVLAMQLVPSFRQHILRVSPAVQQRLRSITIDVLKDVASRGGPTKKKQAVSSHDKKVVDALNMLASYETKVTSAADIIDTVNAVATLAVGPEAAQSSDATVQHVASLVGLVDLEAVRQSKPSKVEPFTLWHSENIHSLAVASGAAAAPALGALSAIAQIAIEDDAQESAAVDLDQGQSKALLAEASKELEDMQRQGIKMPLEACASCRWGILSTPAHSRDVQGTDSDNDDEVDARKRRRSEGAVSLLRSPLRLGALLVQHHPHATLDQFDAARRSYAALLILHAAAARLLMDMPLLQRTPKLLTKGPLAASSLKTLLEGQEPLALLTLLQRIDEAKAILGAAPPLPRQCFTDVLLPIGEAVVSLLHGDPSEKRAAATTVQWFEQLLALYRNGGSAAVRKDSTYAKAVLATDLWGLKRSVDKASNNQSSVGALDLGRLQSADWCRYVAFERRSGSLVKARQLGERALKDAIDARLLLVGLSGSQS